MLRELYADLNHSLAAALADIELADAARFQKAALNGSTDRRLRSQEAESL
jgi:hypothetical protein